MKQILFIIFMTLSSSLFAETYVLPKEIKDLAEKIARGHQELNRNIRIRYEYLIKKKDLTLAEMQEVQAYKTIMTDYINRQEAFLFLD